MAKPLIVPGIHAVNAVLETAPERVLSAWIEEKKRNPRIEAIREKLRSIGISVETSQRQNLDRLCESTQHQGVAIRCAPRETIDEHDLISLIEEKDSPALLLALDEVTDPHNLGACLRVADAAGVDAVILPSHRSAHLSPTVCKVSCGASEYLPIVRAGNLSRLLDTLKAAGYWVTGTVMDTPTSIYECDFTRPTVLIMGAEGTGLRRLTAQKCDFLVNLPLNGSVESLNVSVATGICLYEAVRQRRQSSPA